MYVAETTDAKIVGCVEVRWRHSNPECAWLDRLAVAAHWRRKGVARRLVDRAIDDLRDMAVVDVSLDSISHILSPAPPCVLQLAATTVDIEARVAAVAFWHEMGFRERAGIERKQIGTATAPLALITMHKEIVLTRLPATAPAASADYCATNIVVASAVLGAVFAWLTRVKGRKKSHL